jgi:hypothetical protein
MWLMADFASLMRRTPPFLLDNPIGPETQTSQVWSSDFAIQAILALSPDVLAQRQNEILQSREADIRVKSLGTVQ